MALPDFSMRQLLEAGVHFGHQTHRWNPKMAPYIYGERNGVHIIDLSQTVPALYRGLKAVRDTVSHGGRVLFVGTKRQASAPIAEAARRCGQYYVNNRWLGGMMTNWQTISKSISRLKALDEQLGEEDTGLTKKETLQLTRERDKLEITLGGIREMGGLPDILFVLDTNREDIAVHEAARLGIPVVGVLDTNSDPDGIAFPIPGNDDASRAIDLYCRLVSDAVLDGIQEELASRGVDIGAMDEAAGAKDVKDAKGAAAQPEKADAGKADKAKPAEKAEEKAPAKAEDKAAEKKAEPKKDKKEKGEKAPAKKAAAPKKADDKKEAKKDDKKSTAKKPAAKKTAAGKSASSKPTARKSSGAKTKSSAAKKSTAKKPAAKKTVAKKSTTKKPAVKKSAAKKSDDKKSK